MARRRNHKNRDLPPNLYVRNGYYSYTNPQTGIEYGIGRNKRIAVNQAIEANCYIYSDNKTVLSRMIDQSNVSFYDYLDTFQEKLNQRDLSRSTIVEYKSRIKSIRAGLENKALSEFCTKDIAQFLISFKDNGIPGRAKPIRTTLLDIFREAIAEGHLTTNPVEATKNPKITVQRSRLSLDGYQQILDISKSAQPWVGLSIRLNNCV